MIHIMTEMTTTGPRTGDTSGRARREHGPHPGWLALVSLSLMIAGQVASAAMSGGDTQVSPFGATAEVAARIQDHHEAFRVLAFFQLGSAIPLAIFAAAVYARQLRLGIRVPGPVIGFMGGVIAVGSLLTSAFASYVASRPEVTADASLTQALAIFAFVAGGPGYAVGLGLLFAGIAVPALILRLLPRWLAVVGLVLAILGELTWFGMLAGPMQYLIPVARYLGGLWLIVAGFALPRQRPRRTGNPA